MRKAFKIWLLFALCIMACISLAVIASAEKPVCVGSHTYDNECDKECNVCASIRFAPHKNEDENDMCDLCSAELCEHLTRPDFIDFTGCENPRLCRLCGETDSPEGHYWAPATCSAPKVCSTCRKFDGEPLGHKWGPSTCTTAPVCSTCAKVGEIAGHKYDNNCDSDCNVCAEQRSVFHPDLDKNELCDLCGISIDDGGLNGGEIAVIIILPLLSIGAGVGVYFLLTHIKKKKAATPDKKPEAKPTEKKDTKKPQPKSAEKKNTKKKAK